MTRAIIRPFARAFGNYGSCRHISANIRRPSERSKGDRMATSIEILIAKKMQLPAKIGRMPFSTLVSSPPQSHRGVPSIWQPDFAKMGGTLVHVGDPDFTAHTRRFWAYEILEEIELRRYKFLSRYRKSFFGLLETLLQESAGDGLVLTSDAQFGPKPQRYRKVYSLESAKRLHDRYGLRLNKFMRLAGPR